MTTPILELDGVSRNFAGVRALELLTLSVGAGEPVAVIGPNGSGKTTLFNVVSGYFRPSAGTIRFRGERIDGVPTHAIARRGLARTFQQASAFGNLTVRENIEFGALGTARSRRASDVTMDVDEVLELCNLTELADVVADSLPYGHRRKLGVAIGLATRPSMLLLDEPAAGLGNTESAELGAMILDITRTGVTPVIIDHDMSFVLPLVERVVVLDAGRKIWEGPPDEVRSAPAVRAVYFGDEDDG